MKSLTKATLHRALDRLGELALEAGLRLEICIFGGALMMLSYDSRKSTRDVDAIITPAKEGLSLAKQVGRELGLPENWLNNDVNVFLAPHGQTRELPIEKPGLWITAPTAGYLLAMKALACRNAVPGFGGDLDDLKFLIKKMEITSLEDIQNYIDKYYPDDTIQPQHRTILETLIEDVNNETGNT